MAHLTCVGSTQEMLASVLDEAEMLGIENILALRGDPPRGQTTFTPVAGGFAHAIELVRFVKDRNCFGVGAAAYPEGHVECTSKHLDWDRAAAKVAAGAEYLITQLFYDWNDFVEFEDYLRNKHGVKVPIVPGVLPFLGADQIHRFTTLCGTRNYPPTCASNSLTLPTTMSRCVSWAWRFAARSAVAPWTTAWRASTFTV